MSRAGPAARPRGRRRRQEDEQVARQHHRPAAAHRWRLRSHAARIRLGEEGLRTKENCMLVPAAFAACCNLTLECKTVHCCES